MIIRLARLLINLSKSRLNTHLYEQGKQMGQEGIIWEPVVDAGTDILSTGEMGLQCQRDRGNASCDNFHPTNFRNSYPLDSVLDMTQHAYVKDSPHGLLNMITCIIALFLKMWFMILWHMGRLNTRKGLQESSTVCTIEGVGSFWHVKRCNFIFYSLSVMSLLWLKWEETHERCKRRINQIIYY